MAWGCVQCSGLSLMPGLRQEEGFTTPFGASLFAAATALWRADPWTAIPAARRRPIKVRAPLYAVVVSQHLGPLSSHCKKTVDEHTAGDQGAV